MTWSIVAIDPSTRAFGVAVATRAFAVGALCPFAMSGVGALATQALVNQTFGPRGLRLLAEGVRAQDALAILLQPDAGREHRQLHIVDAAGGVAQHTGADCVDWCGHVAPPQGGVSVAGNMLAGPRVVEDTLACFMDRIDLPFAERLVAAMEAGEAAGGDKRGRQSAALRVHTTEEFPAIDLRVDDHPEPLVELRRLYALSQGRARVFRAHLPTRLNPSGIYDRAVIDAAIAAWEAEARG
jgi:uncharacterized Ntn-hydrolase superfamily protein